MGAHNLGTQIEGLYKLVSATKRNLFLSSVSSIEPIRTLFLDTTRGVKAPQTLKYYNFYRVKYYNFSKNCRHNWEIRES